MNNSAKQIAKLLLESGVLIHRPQSDLKLKSGIFSPIFLDHTQLFAHPSVWAEVIAEMKALVAVNKFEFDVIAARDGTYSAHGLLLSYELKKPFALVRVLAREFGPAGQLEGAAVADKKIIFVEDHVSTGSSSIEAIKVLRKAGATVEQVLAITSFDFIAQEQVFAQQKLKLTILTTFPLIMKQALATGLLTSDQQARIDEWYLNVQSSLK